MHTKHRRLYFSVRISNIIIFWPILLWHNSFKKKKMKLRNYTASFVFFFRGNLTKGIVRNTYGQRLTISDVCSPWENQWRNWFVESGSSGTFLLIFEGSISVAWRHSLLFSHSLVILNKYLVVFVVIYQNKFDYFYKDWHHLDCNWDPLHIFDFLSMTDLKRMDQHFEDGS